MIFEKLLKNLNSYSNEFCYNIKSDLFSEISNNPRLLSSLEDTILSKDHCRTKLIYKFSNKYSSVNSHPVKLLNAGRQFNLISQRNYGTVRRTYTGIGSLNKKYEENRKGFNLRLSSLIFGKENKLNPNQNDKVKSLLADEKLTDEEKQRIKIAFAEGYGASDSKTQTKKGFPGPLSFLRELLTIALICAFLATFFKGKVFVDFLFFSF